jgi:tetratricopeptide (TPR) repeat protein
MPVKPSTSLLAAALLLSSTSVAFAADKPKAPFEMVVTTPEGAPVDGADVAITSSTTVPPYLFTGKTDAAGKAAGELADFKSLYSIKVTKAGYKEFVQELDLTTSKLKKGQTAALKVTLPMITAVEYYNEGAKAIQAKDLPRAAAQLELAIAADPKLAKAYSVLALIELEQSQWDKALAHADQALALDPTDMQALRSRYEAFTGSGDKPKADAALSELAAKDRTPDVARLLYNAGAQAGNAKEVEVARARFLEALAIDPTLHQAHSALAELAIKEKKYPEAIAEIDLAIAAAPRNFKAYERKIEVLKAMGDKAAVEATEKKLAALKAGG